VVFWAGRNLEPALELYREAIGIYEAADMEVELARPLNGALQSLLYLGRYDEAHGYAERAREIFTRQGDRLRLARLDTNLGNLMFRQDRFEEALQLYQKAHSAFVEIGTAQDVAIALKNTATTEISHNDFRQPIATYQQAREYCLRNHTP